MTDTLRLPVLPLRDVVVYPHMVIPLFVGRERSISALDAAMRDDKQILLLAQKSPEVDDPGPDDVYEIGTVASVLQLLKLPDGTIKVLVEGGSRAEVKSLFEEEERYVAEVELLGDSLSQEQREVGVHPPQQHVQRPRDDHVEQDDHEERGGTQPEPALGLRERGGGGRGVARVEHGSDGQEVAEHGEDEDAHVAEAGPAGRGPGLGAGGGAGGVDGVDVRRGFGGGGHGSS